MDLDLIQEFTKIYKSRYNVTNFKKSKYLLL